MGDPHFRDKRLRALYFEDDGSGLSQRLVPTLLEQLTALLIAVHPRQMARPEWNYRELPGNRRGTYSLKAGRNWRLTFRWEDGRAVDVDLEDYH